MVEDNKAVCDRCGHVWQVNLVKANRKGLLCASCRAKTATLVQYGDLKCIPWQGDFDENDQPILDGEYYLPGIRLCNHRDCTNVRHILSIDTNQ